DVVIGRRDRHNAIVDGYGARAGIDGRERIGEQRRVLPIGGRIGPVGKGGDQIADGLGWAAEAVEFAVRENSVPILNARVVHPLFVLAVEVLHERGVWVDQAEELRWGGVVGRIEGNDEGADVAARRDGAMQLAVREDDEVLAG